VWFQGESITTGPVHGLKVKLIQPKLNSFNTKATSIFAILYFKMTKNYLSCMNYSGSGGKAVVLVSWRPVCIRTIIKIKVLQKVLQAMP